MHRILQRRNEECMKLSSRGFEISRISLPRAVWLLLALFMFWHMLYIRLNERNRTRVIDSDGAGYYAYLPALFIYHDLEFKFCQEGQPSKVDFSAANHTLFMNRTAEGKLINKYFIGTAIAELPFFLVAYGTGSWFGYHINGYSFPFQLAIALAAMFYVLLGLDQIRKLLIKKGVSESVVAFLLLLIFLGTNLYHYTGAEPSMSHAYSFCFVALFLNQVYNAIHLQKRRSIAWSIILLAMIILIRPVNGVVLFAIPFIAGSWPALKSAFAFALKNVRIVSIGTIVAFALLFLQLLIYKLSVGKWLADSYSGEHIDLTNAHIHSVLFSWRKGFFVYTPLMIFAVAGFFFLKSHFERFAFLAFWALNVWVISSWQTWMYGGCLGMRPMIDTYAVMAIPLAFFLQSATKKWFKLASLPVLIFVVVLNLIQHYQYNIGILPYDEMTEEKYKKIFLKTSHLYSCIYDPGTLHSHELPQGSRKLDVRIRTYDEDSSSLFETYNGITTEKAFSGTKSVRLDTGQSTCGFRINFKDVIPDSLMTRAWVVVKAKVFLIRETPIPKMAISFCDSTAGYNWQAVPLFFIVNKAGSWQDFEYAVKVPMPNSDKGNIVVFLFHDDQSIAYADDVQVEFWIAP